MKIHRIGAPVILALLLILPVPAGALDDVHLVPVAAHLRGAYGTTWKSDVTLVNPGDAAVTVDILLVASDGAPGDPVRPLAAVSPIVVPPHGSLLVEDALSGEGDGASGALVLVGTGPFAVFARTYTDHAEGSRGSSVPPAESFVDEVARRALLPGLRSDDRFRANVGVVVVADGPEPVVVEVTAGAKRVREVRVDSGEMRHLQFALPPDPGGVVTVRLLSGIGVVASYGTLVDNASGDASFVEPVLLDAEASGAKGRERAADRLRSAARKEGVR